MQKIAHATVVRYSHRYIISTYIFTSVYIPMYTGTLYIYIYICNIYITRHIYINRYIYYCNATAELANQDSRVPAPAIIPHNSIVTSNTIHRNTYKFDTRVFHFRIFSSNSASSCSGSFGVSGRGGVGAGGMCSGKRYG